MTSVPFDIPIIDDNTVECNEDFTLRFVRNTLPDGVNHGNPFRATVIVVDDESELLTNLVRACTLLKYITAMIA